MVSFYPHDPDIRNKQPADVKGFKHFDSGVEEHDRGGQGTCYLFVFFCLPSWEHSLGPIVSLGHKCLVASPRHTRRHKEELLDCKIEIHSWALPRNVETNQIKMTS